MTSRLIALFRGASIIFFSFQMATYVVASEPTIGEVESTWGNLKFCLNTVLTDKDLKSYVYQIDFNRLNSFDEYLLGYSRKRFGEMDTRKLHGNALITGMAIEWGKGTGYFKTIPTDKKIEALNWCRKKFSD